MKPLVSICIPTYNGALFLQQALDSVKKQTYDNFEVIVSDDNSQDNTLDILHSFKKEVNFKVFIFDHIPSGIGANWNHCIKQSHGEYIKFLFQDDILHPSCISEMVSFFNTNPSIGLVGCKRSIILEGDKNELNARWMEDYKNLQWQFEENATVTIIDQELFSRKDFLQTPLNKIGEPPTVMFRRDIVNKVGYFDEELEQKLDYVFYYRILKKYPIAILNKELAGFRIHVSQATYVNSQKEIPDNKKYEEILYKEFLSLLHPTHKKKLALKYSYKAKIINQLQRVLRRFSS